MKMMISCMSPGIKVRVAIRNNGNKEHIQKRHVHELKRDLCLVYNRK